GRAVANRRPVATAACPLGRRPLEQRAHGRGGHASHGSRHGGHPMTRGRRRGFTLIEVVIALTIVATLLVVMFAGLRVGLAAWQRGEARAEICDRTPGLAQILTPTLNAAYPYQRPSTVREPARLLFGGEAEGVAFVTAAAPFPT